jgi:plasmid stability protein
MAQLFVPDLEETVNDRLRARARRHGRSLEDEVCAILEEAAREEPLEQAFQEEGAPMLRGDEKGLGDLMYERFKDQGLTDEEFARFNIGIAEINSMDAMGIPDFDADEFEETPSDK